nr:syntaxin-61 [Ipomoea batatas]
MSSAKDPFYIVKEEIQESIEKLLSTFHQWERTPPSSGDRLHLSKELITTCDSIDWQVDELNKTIAVAARDPSWYGIDEAELEKRRRWTSDAHTQVSAQLLESCYYNSQSGWSLFDKHFASATDPYTAQDNDDFISSESDRQLLLIKQQDEELDVLSASIERIGDVGLTIHDELIGQEKIISNLDSEMDNTSNRLDFVQKKVAMVMKKASAKGQIMMICFLLVLFIVLFSLVFLT